jgi:hypoxanthine phosphoribosyltransferase
MLRLHDKQFIPFIAKNQIDEAILRMARQIDADYASLHPLFIGVLNGAFIFAADLVRALSMQAEISFVKLNSYVRDASTGNVVTQVGIQQNIHGRHIVILEDIIDTGGTLHTFLPKIHKQGAASVKIAALFVKPSATKLGIKADYTGFDIPEKFVVGYGLDYDGLGRNLPELYIHNDQ